MKSIFLFAVVVLMLAQAVVYYYTNDYTQGHLMVLYGAANGVIAWSAL